MRTLTPTARTNAITPFIPAQYNGLGLREINVYKSSGGPASSEYNGRKMQMKIARSMFAQNSLESGRQRQVRAFIASNLKPSPVA
jgi:hypothetical protein